MHAGNPVHRTSLGHKSLDARLAADRSYRLEPERWWPFLKPCEVRLLMVVDGLDYSHLNNFGLHDFVEYLLDIPGRYVRFDITLAHIGKAEPTQMMYEDDRIKNRITEFRFDVPAHFDINMYDVVFLFGIASSFTRVPQEDGRPGIASDGNEYPATQLARPELRLLTEFMNNGGGLFATGDHGNLGRFLSHAVPRARSMRLWESTSAQTDEDQVSMDGERRNDTNRLGRDGTSEFDDQSDDVPQQIQPKPYTLRNGLLNYTFPHPLLCGPSGVIRVMPDHPHEGECVTPADPDLALDFGAPLGPEYPGAADGGARPLPEIISDNTVLSGTTSGDKKATRPQSFGGIAAYDGHRAGVGRVVTDSTWHHFVNVNITGDRRIRRYFDVDPTGLIPPLPNPNKKGWGFETDEGLAHLEDIKAYYRNLAVWLARPERIRCMNAALSWSVLWDDRVMEAVLSTTNVKVAEAEPRILRIIGRHARDVLGRAAGRCTALSLINALIERASPEMLPEVDPWRPEADRPRRRFDGVDWFDASPLLDIALGGALVGLREAVPQPDAEIVRNLDTGRLHEIMVQGASAGLERAKRSAAASAKLVRAALKL